MRSWRFSLVSIIGSLISINCLGNPIFSFYSASGSSVSTTNTVIYSGGNSATNPNGASYTNFYTAQVTDPNTGLPVTSTLAKSDVYSRPGAMGILSYVASPAIGSAQTPSTTSGQAVVREGVSISNQQLNGSVTLSYSLHGNQTLNLGSGPGDFGEFIVFILNDETSASLYKESYISISGQLQETGLATGTVTFPIINGIADMGLVLGATAICGGTCQAAADFYGTLSLGGAQVFDANGILEPGVTIISASGFDYNAPLATGAAVPEPASFGMFAIGLLIIVLISRRAVGSRQSNRPS